MPEPNRLSSEKSVDQQELRELLAWQRESPSKGVLGRQDWCWAPSAFENTEWKPSGEIRTLLDSAIL